MILDHVRHSFPGTVVISPSSLAVDGPAKPGQVNSEMTRPVAQPSYGAQNT